MASARKSEVEVYEYRDRDKVQTISWEELEDVRARELALVRRDSTRDVQDRYRASSRDRDRPLGPDDYLAVTRRTVRRSQDDYTSPRRRRYNEDAYALAPYNRERELYRSRSSRRRDPSPSSDSDSSNDRRRSRHHRHGAKHRHRHRSAAASTKAEEKGNAPNYDDGICWYSGKPRTEAGWHEKTFDSSYDGIIAAVAGAAVGAMTARRFGGEENIKAKVVGGAVAGAVGFNAVENRYRVYTEEREEKREGRDG